jgi:hypothetical protein
MRQLPELVFKPPDKLLLLEKSFVEGEFVKKCLLIAVAELCLYKKSVFENISS